jgi:serine/threonine protein kinase
LSAFPNTENRIATTFNYHLIYQIGQGQYGKVYKAVQKDTYKVYACKKMSMELIREKRCMEDVMNEIANLKRVDHPNIVKLVEEIKTANHHYLFFEYCNGGTITDLKAIAGTLTEGVVRSIAI